jgi:hypothetical protein
MEFGSVQLPPGLVNAQNKANKEPFGVQVANLKNNYNSVESGPFGKQVSALRAQLKAGDTVELGLNPPSTQDALNIVLDRALEQLRQVVGDAQEALGITDTSTLDTSPDATANRIADFALGAFSVFQQNHPELEGDAAKTAFIDLVGGAVAEGIDQARGILDSLSALTPEVQDGITTIQDLVQQRFDAFLNGE